MGISPALVRRAAANYVRRLPYNASFELTHNCNARCRHCHRGDPVRERLATAAELLEVCRRLRPVVAIMSGGEPLLRSDLVEIVSTFKRGCSPLRIFLNTNGALLTRARFSELGEAGVDEVLISLDYPDDRHDEYRRIPGLFRRIERLVAELDSASRRRVVLTCVLQSDNFEDAPELARLALGWGVNVNFSAYTWLRTRDTGLMVGPDQRDRFSTVIESLIRFKAAHGNVLTSDWVLRRMVRFYEEGSLAGCRAGERTLVVNPDGTLSPCGLHVKDYASLDQLRRDFTRRNDCGFCYTSTRGNSERPLKHLLLDHVAYLRGRAG